jgi:hypothetical protein
MSNVEWRMLSWWPILNWPIGDPELVSDTEWADDDAADAVRRSAFVIRHFVI